LGYPFKIPTPVIRLVEIYVVRVPSAWTISEREQDKPMDVHECSSIAVPVETDLNVPYVHQLVLEYVTAPSALPRADASNPSKVADLVPAFVADNRPPFFARIKGRLIEHREVPFSGVMRAVVSSGAPASLYPMGGAI